MQDFVKNNMEEAHKILFQFLSENKNIESIKDAIHMLTKAYKGDAKVFSCGNGGSCCDAMHFAEELTGRFRKDRAPLAATSIIDPSHLTCVANDFGYDHIFSRYLEAWARKGDCLLAISTSGNSKNVINAVKMAKTKGAGTIGLLGKDGGALKDLVDIPIIVSGTNITDRIQEIHIKIIHTLIEGIERELFPDNYN